jgi:glyoxylase-like metal-dependent hydrolase (beta-lactamase superfamily II)
MSNTTLGFDRRQFLARSTGCAAWIAGLALAPTLIRRAFAAIPYGQVVAETDFARVEQIADGVWAIISTPLKNGGRHFTTTANGGIISGRDGALLIEAFYSAEGAVWAAGVCQELTGRRPDRVAVTHYHADHTRGLGALAGMEQVESTLLTDTTHALLDPADPMPERVVLDGNATTDIDLGGRTVRIQPRGGHTASDVTIQIDDPAVVWCGDLVWNGMFPNFVDARPSQLIAHCEQILGRYDTHYVPGHGNAGDAAALDSYLALLHDLHEAAERARVAGASAQQAAEAYRLPPSLGDWVRFSDDYFIRAFTAWERERGAR